MKYHLNRFLVPVALATCLLASCTKFLDLQPIDSPTEANFYVDEKGMQGAIIAAYDAYQSTDLYGINFLTLAEVRSDNILNNNPAAGGGVNYEIESFSETPINSVVASTWLGSYRAIYRCNVVLDKLDGIAFDSTRKNYVKGQALFLRSLAYFNAVRLWGGLPLITSVQSTDQSRLNKRADSAAIYTQIKTDLTAAAALLPTTWPAADRGRATSYAALALLGKVYVYQKDFAAARNTLQPLVAAINNGAVVGLVPQTTTFPAGLKTSKDVLFAVQYLGGGIGEGISQNNRYRNQDNNNVITLPQTDFETGDIRKALVAPVGNGLRPGKFNSTQVNNETTGDFAVLRCADVMLLYAEALNELSYPDANAFDALNKVRSNAGLTVVKTVANTPTAAAFRTAVYKERRLELALECDRWFDLVRTGQMAVIFPLVPAFRRLYPIPQTEIDNVTDKTGWQNAGY